MESVNQKGRIFEVKRISVEGVVVEIASIIVHDGLWSCKWKTKRKNVRVTYKYVVECHSQTLRWRDYDPMEIGWRRIHTFLKSCLDNCTWHIRKLVWNQNRKAICYSWKRKLILCEWQSNNWLTSSVMKMGMRRPVLHNYKFWYMIQRSISGYRSLTYVTGDGTRRPA